MTILLKFLLYQFKLRKNPWSGWYLFCYTYEKKICPGEKKNKEKKKKELAKSPILPSYCLIANDLGCLWEKFHVLVCCSYQHQLNSNTRSGCVKILKITKCSLFLPSFMQFINVCKYTLFQIGSIWQRNITADLSCFHHHPLDFVEYILLCQWAFFSNTVIPTISIFLYKQKNHFIVLHKNSKWKLKCFLYFSSHILRYSNWI